ncbi:hypothetical protein [Seohaeicola zhoushanensis]|uniref:Flagellar protein FlgN n=1 Tax=Seohaeicola zhoushanensis TaxID=1569283 RepID=A0A8J3GUT5_9RHOB|nr:hypothetical protein [Seohaeicola zhoushanensis]GHF36293.1 hypothetical protein GCM10017056_05140 [Seohaeicola zhoushanensis]
MTAASLIIERLTRVLHDEIAAIGAGQLETVRELYPEKLSLYEELEAQTEHVERQLQSATPEAQELRASLEVLHGLIRKDHALLQQLTNATERVVKELNRIRDRHGLGGIYEASGSLRPQVVARPQQVDETI